MNSKVFLNFMLAANLVLTLNPSLMAETTIQEPQVTLNPAAESNQTAQMCEQVVQSKEMIDIPKEIRDPIGATHTELSSFYNKTFDLITQHVELEKTAETKRAEEEYSVIEIIWIVFMIIFMLITCIIFLGSHNEIEWPKLPRR